MNSSSPGTPRSRLRETAAGCYGLSQELSRIIAIKPRVMSEPSFAKLSHAQPPWNAAAALSMMNLHQLARDLEARFRISVRQPVRWRGGSDENTRLALEAISRLAEAADDHMVSGALRELNGWQRQARVILGELELPQRLPRLPGQAEPVCPFCQTRTLRMLPLEGVVFCIGTCRPEGKKPRAQMEWSGFTRSWELVWQDGTSGMAVSPDKSVI